jgi:hypothetical protein
MFGMVSRTSLLVVLVILPRALETIMTLGQGLFLSRLLKAWMTTVFDVMRLL